MSNSLGGSNCVHRSEMNQVMRNTFSSFEKMLPTETTGPHECILLTVIPILHYSISNTPTFHYSNKLLYNYSNTLVFHYYDTFT